MRYTEFITEKWSQKYKSSINCGHPKGFSQRAHCASKNKHNESAEMEMVCETCGMCQTHGNVMEIRKGQKDSNGYTRCWPGKHAEGTKTGKNGGQVRNCVPNESMLEDSANKCPPATQDITLNLKNRQKAINEYGYGPLNPDLPNTKFWMKKVDEWNLDSAEEAKSSLCGNCAAFDQRKDTLDCIAQGIDSESPEDAQGTIDAGDLGYCRFLKFKCASRRTCDAWVIGGPLTDKPVMAEGGAETSWADGKNPVKFTVTTPDGYTHSFQITLAVHGKHVGHFNFVRGADTDDVNNEAEVESRWQGQGYGKLLLMKAIDVANNHGLDFQQDIRGITDGQQNVYDSLENAGLIVTPGDGFWFLTPQGEQELNGLNENFADGRTLILPTPEEDAQITAAAMTDPDNLPLTDKQWDKVKPSLMRGRGRPLGSGKK